ncbi:Hypothetical predicted protein [Mytilus galloprovincialis]|uniref:G-protein coupled receptors family 1 profile domain-containing protein n=1 Tax=Mytilus galloprovincialis TaxID=29158 RepID=A0A8B6GS24_MYTGA|nr:Hypothetical predicted protein [Mytilus galloprovincialis]
MNENISALNGSLNVTDGAEEEQELRWGMLSLLALIFCTTLGNLLVCLAVIWDRRLQNMTNYFLMSLAIADFLVSILVMPFGMVVEIYGTFPFRAELCMFWVTMDVLMCTASIWHMCTMSMDRYFTLKYPMRYGRNKTKMMVVLKIFFVWAVSITISSPLCIYGIQDSKYILNDGLCAPAIEDFVIYGSVFAFYIPLVIMLVTYVLTIRILWQNQVNMQRIDRSDLRYKQKKDKKKKSFKAYLSPPSDEGSQRHSVEQLESDTDNTVLASIPVLPQKDHLYTEKVCKKIPKPKQNWERRKASSFTCLPTYPKYTTIKPKEQTSDLLRVNSIENVSKGKNIFGASSFCNLNDTDIPFGGGMRNVMFHSCGNLDFKSAGWKQNYFQIQSEMDQIIRDGEKENKRPTPESLSDMKLHKIQDWSEMKFHKMQDSMSDMKINRIQDSVLDMKLQKIPDSILDTKITKQDDSLSDIKLHDLSEDSGAPNLLGLPASKVVSESEDSLDETSSSGSDFLTIKLRPQSFHMYKLNTSVQTSSSPLLGNSTIKNHVNGFCQKMYDTTKSSDSLASSSDRPEVSRSIKSLLHKFNKAQDAKHTMSRKATSNEKKASKVLGIIFGVFVVLWTPFFFVNILSGFCESCMEFVTPYMMSIFLWMGYVASLANPIIYTMFNTAFRRAFIRILKCHLCTKGHIRSDIYNGTSFPTSHNITNDRRNTVTVLIKDEIR